MCTKANIVVIAKITDLDKLDKIRKWADYLRDNHGVDVLDKKLLTSGEIYYVHDFNKTNVYSYMYDIICSNKDITKCDKKMLEQYEKDMSCLSSRNDYSDTYVSDFARKSVDCALTLKMLEFENSYMDLYENVKKKWEENKIIVLNDEVFVDPDYKITPAYFRLVPTDDVLLFE